MSPQGKERERAASIANSLSSARRKSLGKADSNKRVFKKSSTFQGILFSPWLSVGYCRHLSNFYSCTLYIYVYIYTYIGGREILKDFLVQFKFDGIFVSILMESFSFILEGSPSKVLSPKVPAATKVTASFHNCACTCISGCSACKVASFCM